MVPATVIVERADLALPASLGPPARRAALSSLDAAAWPRASETEEAWLIIRGLDVTAAPWDLGARAAAEAAARDAGAVDGWLANAGDVAVRFGSRAELLARLSRDLAAGTATGLWFWRSLLRRLPPGAPARQLGALWSDEPLRLPDIVWTLERRAALPVVLAMLDEAAVRQIAAALAAATGWPLPPMSSDPPGFPARLEASRATPDAAAAPAAAVARARAIARAVPEGAAHPELLRLGAVLALWREAPHLLAAPTGGIVAARLAEAASAAPATGPDDGWASRAAAAGPPATFVAGSRAVAAGAGSIETFGAPTEVDTGGEAGPPGRRERDVAPEEAAIATAPAAFAPTPRAGPRAEAGMPPVPEALLPVEEAPGDGFVTASGGLFFLLNALDLPAARAIMEASAAPGWHWLGRLGIHLDLAPDPGLARFLAAALGQSGTSPDLPPLPQEETLFALLARRYAPTRVWNPGLLARPAVVRATRTHLDIDMRLQDVRLDVRRAGLDLDPGWLPWLGRVVAFHFGWPPALAGMPSAPDGDGDFG